MTTEAIRLTSPGDLVASVPFILGFHPADSLVIVSIRDGRVGLTTRIDLPTNPDVADSAEMLSSLMTPLRRSEPDSLVVLAYGDFSTSAEQLLVAAATELRAAGFTLMEVILVTGDTWRSLDHPEAQHPSPDEHLVNMPGSAVPAEFIGRGIAPLTDRQELVRLVESQPEAHRVRTHLDRARTGSLDLDRGEVRCAVAGLWDHLLDTTPDAAPITGPEAALAALSLRDVALRDGIIAWLTPGMLETTQLPKNVQAVLNLLPDHDRGTESGGDDTAVPDWESGMRTRNRLISLCALLPDPHAATMLTVLASHSWWRGEGAITRVALDRALRCEPANQLARLLDLMVSQGISPVTQEAKAAQHDHEDGKDTAPLA